GGMSWDSYAQHLNDPETLELCRRVVPVNDPQVEAEFPAHMSGSARVRTPAGELQKLIVVAKGEPENFLSADELRAKFDGLVSPYMDEAARGQAASALLSLHEKLDIGSVLALSRPRPATKPRTAGGHGDD
ncbi:MAG: MmgE/PrpD family protein, partial [Gammaproteobacteria bacterium]